MRLGRSKGLGNFVLKVVIARNHTKLLNGKVDK